MTKTVGACTRHIAVERQVQIRSRALALTRDNPLDGGDGVKYSSSSAISDCREYDTNFRAAMCVIWSRLHRSKNPRHILLALDLLSKLISEGPLTAITEALDGLRIIDTLKCFSDGKNGDANREVRQAASRVYGLMVDLPTLFAVRRHVAVAKAEVIMQQSSWSNYIFSRLPLKLDGQKVHSLFRPRGMSVQRRILYDEDNSLDAVIVDASDDDASSIAALCRLGGENCFPAHQDQDNIDLDWMNHHFEVLLRQSEPVTESTGQRLTEDSEVEGGITAGHLSPD